MMAGVAAAALGVAGCVGDTDPATKVRAHQAQLNAHGHTNNGPAYWWWEYGTTRKSVENGLGTKTPRTGPASSASDVSLNRTITGLDRLQSYYFRACGQDQAAGSAVTCGRVLSFSTAPGDSTVKRPPGYRDVYFQGAPEVRHSIVLTAPAGDPFAVDIREIEDATVVPPTGSSIAALDSACVTFASDYHLSYHDTARCAPPSAGVATTVNFTLGPYVDNVVAFSAPTTSLYTSLGGGNDFYDGGRAFDDVNGQAGNDEIYGEGGHDLLSGGPGNDILHGDTGSDEIYGDDGNDAFYGGDGNDTIHGGAGINGYDCGPGTDVIYVNSYNEWGLRSTNCESYVIETP